MLLKQCRSLMVVSLVSLDICYELYDEDGGFSRATLQNSYQKWANIICVGKYKGNKAKPSTGSLISSILLSPESKLVLSLFLRMKNSLLWFLLPSPIAEH